MLPNLLVCNHTRTPVHEGKCYCPDCGSGVIYRWVVLRCVECQARRESRYRFRAIVPCEPCCALCGASVTRLEILENPHYYQLYRARLMVWLEEKQRPVTAVWLRYLVGEPLGSYLLACLFRT